MQNISMGELTKLVVCILVIVSAVVLGIAKVVEGEAVVGMITGSLGYVFGNGHGILSAKRNQK